MAPQSLTDIMGQDWLQWQQAANTIAMPTFTSSGTTNVFVGPQMAPNIPAPAPAREKTAMEWLHAEVDEICELGRLVAA